MITFRLLSFQELLIMSVRARSGVCWSLMMRAVKYQARAGVKQIQ